MIYYGCTRFSSKRTAVIEINASLKPAGVLDEKTPLLNAVPERYFAGVRFDFGFLLLCTNKNLLFSDKKNRELLIGICHLLPVFRSATGCR